MNAKISDINTEPGPSGALTLQTVTMPRDTNANGDIFGGWLLSQMDLAGGICAAQTAGGRVATVAIEEMNFLVPVEVGALISCYTRMVATGRSSVQVAVEVWKSLPNERRKVTDGIFVYVAIDKSGRTRPISRKMQNRQAE